jgi:hypothetical protein
MLAYILTISRDVYASSRRRETSTPPPAEGGLQHTLGPDQARDRSQIETVFAALVSSAQKRTILEGDYWTLPSLGSIGPGSYVLTRIGI